jgi:hypothetical protein
MLAENQIAEHDETDAIHYHFLAYGFHHNTIDRFRTEKRSGSSI